MERTIKNYIGGLGLILLSGCLAGTVPKSHIETKFREVQAQIPNSREYPSLIDYLNKEKPRYLAVAIPSQSNLDLSEFQEKYAFDYAVVRAHLLASGVDKDRYGFMGYHKNYSEAGLLIRHTDLEKAGFVRHHPKDEQLHYIHLNIPNKEVLGIGSSNGVYRDYLSEVKHFKASVSPEKNQIKVKFLKSNKP